MRMVPTVVCELYDACVCGRRGHAVLRAALPNKEEYVILVRMSEIQRQLYNAFMTVIKEGGLASWTNSNNPIKAFSVFCKVSVYNRYLSLSFLSRYIW